MPGDIGHDSLIAWLPTLLYSGRRFESGLALVCDSSGRIARIARADELKDEKRIHLSNRAMLPGMVNAHSHAFQRVLRGRTEYRASGQRNSFWTWREMMYSAATRLTPDDVYDASRMAFLEMALSGITAVGEFHYLHHGPDGTPYDDPNLLAKEVARAAGDVGLRIALLRAAYARSGFQTELNPRQVRFIENDPEVYLRNLASLRNDLRGTSSPNVAEGSDTAWAGAAPHSVRAVPLDYLREVITYANRNDLMVHMHVAEQPAEISACVEEYGRTPVALLDSEALLSERFTAVHAIHVTPKAVPALARAGAMVCACPTTERNLGDGVVPADEYFKHDVRICLGTDSHAQIDLLEDARELEYHLRMQKLERAVLDDGSTLPHGRVSADESTLPDGRVSADESTLPDGRVSADESTLPDGRVSADGSTLPDGRVSADGSTLPDGRVSAIATRLFECGTVNGARSIGAQGGALEAGRPADFFTVALDDPTIAGASPDDLLASIVFASTRAAVREVVVGGKPIVSEGQHLVQEEVVERFGELQKRLWS